MDTSQLQDLLGDGGSDDTATSGGRDQSDSDGSTLAGDLDGNGVDVLDLVTPVASSDGDHIQLGVHNSTLDGTLDFLGNFGSETQMAVLITDEDHSSESGSLTGSGLLLNGGNLHDFFLEDVLEKGVDNLGLLDGDGESVDFFDLLDDAGLDESAELGDGGPFFIDGSSSALGLVVFALSAEASSVTASFTTSVAISASPR